MLNYLLHINKFQIISLKIHRKKITLTHKFTNTNIHFKNNLIQTQNK